MNLPYGGAKGGVIVDPSTLSKRELEKMTRRYATEISLFIGPERDIPAPDVGTNAQVMAWIMDTYSMHKGYSIPAVITGKPVAIGGTVGREYATGLGVTYVTRAVLRQRLGRALEDVTVAVQGFGNVGSWTARSLHERSARIVAVSDKFGGIYNANGLDLRLLLRHVADTGSVKDFAQSTPLTNAELLELDVDVLVPAAMEGQITKQNADRIRAKVIAEGANGPTTPDADEILDKKGIIVIPDILCNAGGVVVSYFEWVQSLQSYFWDENEVRRQMERKLLDNLDVVMHVSAQRKCTLRIAAYVTAVERIMEAIQLRGIYP
jgi:glutamate dehydrogenase (NAD(P)+)